MSNPRFDGGPTTESCPSLALGVGGGVGSGRARDQQFGGPKMASSFIAAVANGLVGPVAGDALHLPERGLHGVTVIGVLFKVECAEDDAVRFTHDQRGLRPKLVFLVRL